MQLDDSQVDRVLFGKIISRYAMIGIVQRAAADVSLELRQSAVSLLRAECGAFQNERATRFGAGNDFRIAPRPKTPPAFSPQNQKVRNS